MIDGDCFMVNGVVNEFVLYKGIIFMCLNGVKNIFLCGLMVVCE